MTEHWITIVSHPSSGLAYQEATVDGLKNARVIQDQWEIVSPHPLVDSVYAQYRGRVQRWIEDDEQAQAVLDREETESDRAAWRAQDA